MNCSMLMHYGYGIIVVLTSIESIGFVAVVSSLQEYSHVMWVVWVMFSVAQKPISVRLPVFFCIHVQYMILGGVEHESIMK